MAAAAFQATPGKDRFYRMTTLMIKGGTKIIRGLFDDIHPPSTLANALQNQHKGTLEDLKRRRVLPRPEWDKLFPTSTSCGKSEDFDLTLLFKLLREICNLTMPSTGWDKLPNDTDLSLEADLARIKYHRNVTFAHNDEMEISENEFNDYWVQVKDALLRIVGIYALASTVKEWEEEIDKSRTAPISAEDIKNYLLGLPAITVKCVIKWLRDATRYVLEQFGDDLQLLLTTIQDGIFPDMRIVVQEVYTGSVMILLRVEDLDALEDFWKRYQTGKLRDDLENILVTKEIRSQLGDEVEFTVTVSEDEYLHARCFLDELMPYRKKALVAPEAVKEVTETIEELSLSGIVYGTITTDRKSKFQAHFAEVTSQDQVRKVLDRFTKNSKMYDEASNIIWASRVFEADESLYLSDSDDGGEYLAGRRLEYLLEEIDARNVVVIVTCWQGEVYLGLDMFENINKCALNLLISHGRVEYKTPEDVVLFLEKIEDYFEAKKHKAAHAAYRLVKQAEGKPLAEFEIIHGEVTPPDRKSKFQAHLAHVTSEGQVEQVLTQLKKDRKIAGATYNMLAYRIYIEEKKTYLEAGRDDGEARAGRRLLELLQVSNVENAVVIVTRWHG
ncbi:hypothetical protein QZH41_007462, partial [Actinostola sp. cb2023]